MRPKSFKNVLTALSHRIEARAGWVMAAYVVLYLGASFLIARTKLIWDDEFFTLYLSTSSGSDSIRTALMTGADQHPPLFYVITHLLFTLFGVSHLTLRAPACAGVLMMAVCVYFFVRRRTSRTFGLVGFLLSLQTGVFYYATEARGYGLALGFSALALLFWQEATSSSRRRVFTLFGLGASLALAVSSHYYAILFLGPLALGELARTVRTRTLDIPLWVAFTAPAIPFFLFYPVIEAARGYSKTFWAFPSWSSSVTYYAPMFGDLILGTVLCSLAVIAYLQFGRSEDSVPRSGRSVFVPHEVVALVAVALLPFLAITIAMFVTNAFHPRYVLSPVFGLTILFTFLLYEACRREALAGALLLGALTISLLILRARDARVAEASLADGMRAARFLLSDELGDLPIVVSEVTIFHRLSFYSTPKLADRLVYLAHPEKAIAYLGHDTIDRGLLDLRPWFPLRAVDYEQFTAATQRFLVYGYIGEWTWLSTGLVADGFSLRLVGRDETRVLLLATKKGGVNETTNALRSIPMNSTEFPLRTKNSVGSGPELSRCERWMDDSVCHRFGRETPSFSRRRRQRILRSDIAVLMENVDD